MGTQWAGKGAPDNRDTGMECTSPGPLSALLLHFD